MILGLAGFCIIASDDLIHKSDLTIISWVVVGFFTVSCIGFIYIFEDEIRRETIIDYTHGKYQLETEIYSDTTYFVKRCKE